MTDHIENLHQVIELKLIDPRRFWEIVYVIISVTEVDFSVCSKQLRWFTPTVWLCLIRNKAQSNTKFVIFDYREIRQRGVIYRDRNSIPLNGFHSRYPPTPRQQSIGTIENKLFSFLSHVLRDLPWINSRTYFAEPFKLKGILLFQIFKCNIFYYEPNGIPFGRLFRVTKKKIK